MKYRNPLPMLLLVLCIALAACASMENQTDYPFQSEDGVAVLHVGEIGNECVMALNGTISHDMVRAFELAAEDLASRKCTSKWVLLDSIGGKVEASYLMGNIIREKGFNTRLSNMGGICISSCGMLFIAGVKREARDSTLAGAHLGFHQMSSRGRCIQSSEVKYKRLLNYASRLLPPGGAVFFVNLVRKTGCHDMAIIPFKQLKDVGIITGENAEN